MYEKVTIHGTEYIITGHGVYDMDGSAVSFHAVSSDGRRVVLTCPVLDPSDPLCYDIERPSCIIEMD
jgi:hypothetical protein